MSISREILGMNARNFLYIGKYNTGSAKRAADDKLATKKRFAHHNIPTATILHTFITRNSIKTFDWNLPLDGFAIKPARGYGGEGILVFKHWENGIGTTVSGKTYNLKQIKSHILDIFDGIYSLQETPDCAFIEERILPDPFFKKIASIGICDLRVIVFNKIPIMAMLRLPTLSSGGKANLHQGAIGIGIGMRTGITKNALSRGKNIKYIPDTKVKTSGIKIPNWDEVLLLASRAQDASGLGFAGVDIVFDRDKGPVVIEINARPGLSIQSVNLASLRSRLERVEDLVVNNAERGVEIAKSVFAENFSYKVNGEKKVLSVIEPVNILTNGIAHTYQAKLDTGAYRTSIDLSVANALELPISEKQFDVVSASGRQTRASVRVQFELSGKKISTIATVTNRSHMRFPMIIGRRDLVGFYVNPALHDRDSGVLDDDKDIEDDL